MFIRPVDISKATGGILSRSHALTLEKQDPTFPKRVKLSERRTGWDAEEIHHYIRRFKEVANA